jgi:hypothetical protein
MMAEMSRNKLRNVIFHVFLHAIWQLRKSLVAQIVVPPDDLDPFSRLGMFDKPMQRFLLRRRRLTLSLLNCSDEIPVKLKNMLSAGNQSGIRRSSC